MKSNYLPLLAYVLMLSSVTSAKEKKESNPKKPNIIFILSDDQGYKDLGCYGAQELKTPNIDKIAETGVKFTQFYGGAAISSPSRASLLTGRSCLEVGCPNNVPRGWEDPEGTKGLPSQNRTIAENLHDNGYFTALIGKWHLGEGMKQRPNNQGFDYFFGHVGGCFDSYSHYFFWSGPNIHDLWCNQQEVFYPGYFFSDLMTQEVCKIIETKKDKPFFVYCSFNVPHYPYQGDVKWLDYYCHVPSPRREYISFVSTMDERVGRIVEKLKEEGIYENTVLIFQADQGYSVEERAGFGGGDAGVLRGCKASAFEGGIRVPAIISCPNMFPAGKTIDQMAYGVDWYNTIAELSGSEKDPNSQGTSLVPLIKGETDKHPDVMNWLWGSFDDTVGQWVVRQGPWKLIGNVKDHRAPNSLSPEDRKIFLANLDEDITESENLASKYPEKVKELLTIHKQWYEQAKKSSGCRFAMNARKQNDKNTD